jgi:hypothetical protein
MGSSGVADGAPPGHILTLWAPSGLGRASGVVAAPPVDRRAEAGARGSGYAGVPAAVRRWYFTCPIQARSGWRAWYVPTAASGRQPPMAVEADPCRVMLYHRLLLEFLLLGFSGLTTGVR